MKCEEKQCWCLVTASNNLQHQEERREFQASDVFLICADGVLLKGVWKTQHQSSCLRGFSHRFAVCCNLVRCMSHSKPWNKSSKLRLGSPLWRAGVCSAACSSTGSLALLWCLTISHDESSLCRNVGLEIGSMLFSVWLTTVLLPARNVQKKKKKNGSLWQDAEWGHGMQIKSSTLMNILIWNSKLVWRTVSQLLSCSLTGKSWLLVQQIWNLVFNSKIWKRCTAKVHVQFSLCGFTPENNDQFFISILSLIIRSEWVLCKTKLKIWLFTVLSPSMQIINHSDRKSMVCSSLIFGTWLNDVRFVLVQRGWRRDEKQNVKKPSVQLLQKPRQSHFVWC